MIFIRLPFVDFFDRLTDEIASWVIDTGAVGFGRTIIQLSRGLVDFVIFILQIFFFFIKEPQYFIIGGIVFSLMFALPISNPVSRFERRFVRNIIGFTKFNIDFIQKTQETIQSFITFLRNLIPGV